MPVTAIVQRPSTSLIELQQSPKALEIRIPGASETNASILIGLLFLIASIPFSIHAPLAFILLLFLSSLLLQNGINRGSTSVVKFTRRYFTRSKERQIFSYPQQWVLDKVPTANIRIVAHYHLVPRQEKAVETDTEQVVAIKTEAKTYYLGQFIVTGEKLSHDECMWLATEIRGWLERDTHFER